MPESCAAFGCTSRRKKGSGVSFHRFPIDNAPLLSKWVVNVSRENFHPSRHHVLCSNHFVKSDYVKGIHPRDCADISYHELHEGAVPSVFPSHPSHKQKSLARKRPPPRERTKCPTVEAIEPCPAKRVKGISNDHTYSTSSGSVEKKLLVTRQLLQDARNKVRVVKQKAKRQNIRIANLLQQIKDRKLISSGQYDLLKANFGENTLSLIENELKAIEGDKRGHRYSQELKEFAVTLHFYSAQAYEFLRDYLHLPHASTIRKWSASLNCEPGFLTEVIQSLKEKAENNQFMKHCTIVLDAMAIKKEVIYDPKQSKYAGFIDCGNFLPTSDDSLATEALVFMAVGLTGRWKYPVAYFLTDHLSGEIQAEIVKQLICALTDAGMVVHGIICDGSYANQCMATHLGCSIMIPGRTKAYFPHPQDPEVKVNFVQDACHLIKLVRNCLATLGSIYHDGERISWSFIEQLYKFQQRDTLHIANKLKTKHVQWKRHKMNVKVAVQALSSSVADAIDFLREDLHVPEFAGSAKTTEFIRKMDKLFDLMNSRTPKGKGYKRPMTLVNLGVRKEWLQNTKKYIQTLKDPSGQALVLGRRKTAWMGFVVTIDSVLEICDRLLLTIDTPFQFVCTYKMSQDHLEMLFSRIRRRGGWNNNPNCLQFKWALRSILLKNKILPSKNANVTVEEPLNRLFPTVASASIRQSHAKMQEFAKLLQEPSVYHDHVLHYMAGYITRHVLSDCRCTQCCLALHQNTTPDDPLPASLTQRKDRGGLIKPRDDVYKIIKATDTVFRTTLSAVGPLKTSNSVIARIQSQVLESVRDSVFVSINDHFSEQDLTQEDDHGNQLVKMFSGLFLRTVLHHHGRLYTERFVKENQASKRHTLTKSILWMGD